MLLRVVQTILLGLIIIVACDDESNDYKLGVTDAKLKDGKGTINVQLTKGDDAVTDQEGTEVTLTIACGAKQSKNIKAELDKDGKASVDVDLSGEGWTVEDWGECKISASTTVEDTNIEVKEVKLKTISGEGATDGACEKVGGCDDDQLPSYYIGEEIGQQSLAGGGKLKLHGCSNANLYTVSGDNVSRDADGVVEAEAQTMNIPVMFVLGSAGSNCKLQQTKAGETTATDWATISDAAAGDNLAAGLAVTLGGYTEENKKAIMRVTLPSKPQEYVAAPTVYTSVDAGATATKFTNAVAWEDTLDTATTWDSNKASNYKALLRVTMATSDSPPASDTASNSNNTAWWHMYPDIHIGGDVKIGREFTLNGVTGTVKVKVAESCGLHFFILVPDGKHHRPYARVPITGNALSYTLDTDAKSFEMLAVDGGSASYKANCNIAVDIDGIRVLASSTAIDSARPAITGITMNTTIHQGNNKVGVKLPAWNKSHGSAAKTRIQANRDGGEHSWTLYPGNSSENVVSWENTETSYNFDGQGQNNPPSLNWNATATQNQALVSVNITPTDSKIARTWWYYAEGK